MNETSPHPRPYATPELLLYGDVRTLTTSGMVVEVGVEICQPIVTRRHCN